MKRSNIDAMICKQEGITEITRDEIHRIQLEKLNIVLKREKEREGFYRDLPERLESLIDLRSLPFTTETDLARDGGRMLHRKVKKPKRTRKIRKIRAILEMEEAVKILPVV